MPSKSGKILRESLEGQLHVLLFIENNHTQKQHNRFRKGTFFLEKWLKSGLVSSRKFDHLSGLPFGWGCVFSFYFGWACDNVWQSVASGCGLHSRGLLTLRGVGRRKQSREAAKENYRISFSGAWGEGQVIVARNYEVCAFRAKSGRCPCLIWSPL